MEKILLSTANKNEQRIAVLTNGIISDYISLIPGHEDRKGRIYRGEVAVVEPSLDACFVEIGDEKKGFLRLSEIDEAYLGDEVKEKGATARENLKPGTPVLVKIVKDSRGEKGPLLSTRIDLSSSNLVLMPLSKDAGVRISRQADERDRERLVSEKSKLNLPEGMGMIIRSNGTDKPITELEWQLSSYLVPFWNKIREIFNKLDSPALIYEDSNIVNTCLSEYFSPKIAEIVCDEEEIMQETKESVAIFMPSMVDKVRMVREDESLFDENIQAQLDALMARKVTLPSGGELVIDITEALVAIDINSKRSRGQSGIENTAHLTNIEAATEIARQLRLRNLSGLIVIDFIDMEEESNKEALVQHVRRCLRSDKAQISTSEISRFGLMEMTRQNIGRPLHESHTEICKVCQGTGRLPTVSSFARSILDKIRETCLARKQTGSIMLQLPADAATYLLNEHRRQLLALQDDMHIELIILPSYSMNIPEHRIRVEKEMRQPKTSKSSYEMDTGVKLEQESYLGESKKQHKYSPPAISSFKAERQSQEQTQDTSAAENGSEGLLSRIANFFGGGSAEKKTENAASKDRNGSQSFKTRAKSSRRRGNGRSRGKGSSSREASSNKNGQRQNESKQRKSGSQERGKRASSTQKPAKPDQEQPNKTKQASDNKQFATQEKPAFKPKTSGAANQENDRQPSQSSTPARQPGNDAGKPSVTQEKQSPPSMAKPVFKSKTSATASQENDRQQSQSSTPARQPGSDVGKPSVAQDKQPLGNATSAKPSKAENSETETTNPIRTRDPGNSLRRNKS